MKIFTKKLWTKEEYNYETFTDFIPTITGYVHDNYNTKPTVIVVPGGGYVNVTPTEGEVVALKFLSKGYNAFVVTYSTMSANEMSPLKYQAVRDLAKAVALVRENAIEWRVDIKKICTIGFSAGGHLVSSLGVHHNKEFLEDIRVINDIKPNAQVLSYPVITTTEDYVHQGSKDALLGKNPSYEEALFMSTEKQIGNHTPPTFLWHCVDDRSVPVENTLEFAKSLKEHDVQFGLHIYPFGSHGISTSDSSWVEVGYNANSYTFELIRKLMERKIQKGDISFTKDEFNNMNVSSLDEMIEEMDRTRTFKDVLQPQYMHTSSWVNLVVEWLDVIFS